MMRHALVPLSCLSFGFRGATALLSNVRASQAMQWHASGHCTKLRKITFAHKRYTVMPYQSQREMSGTSDAEGVTAYKPAYSKEELLKAGFVMTDIDQLRSVVADCEHYCLEDTDVRNDVDKASALVEVKRKALHILELLNADGSGVDYVMSNEWQNRWNLSKKAVMSAIAAMKEDGLTEEESKQTLRGFLYAKGIFYYPNTAISRKLQFDNLLNPSHEKKQLVQDKLKLSLQRLENIVDQVDEGNYIEEGASLFDKFVADHPEWGPDTGYDSYVVFRDHDDLKSKPHAYVEPIQPVGLCYMHAPVVLQHYLVTMHSDKHVPMLDMAEYIRRYLKADQLEDRIRWNQGCSSESFLEEIIVPATLEHFPDSTNDDLPNWCAMGTCLQLYGPALVSQFEVEESFCSKHWQHIGNKGTGKKGLHSMVLVGKRKRITGLSEAHSRYLLQNWWSDKPFVEVDEEYLHSCNAKVTFVKTPQTAMGDFLVNYYPRVDCGLVDVPEKLDVPEKSDFPES